jgi:hypothetical protein
MQCAYVLNRSDLEAKLVLGGYSKGLIKRCKKLATIAFSYNLGAEGLDRPIGLCEKHSVINRSDVLKSVMFVDIGGSPKNISIDEAVDLRNKYIRRKLISNLEKLVGHNYNKGITLDDWKELIEAAWNEKITRDLLGV